MTILEWYRVCLMKKLIMKREGMQKNEKGIYPNILKQIDMLISMARNYLAIASSPNVYEVDNRFERHVDLNAHTCTYRAWEL